MNHDAFLQNFNAARPVDRAGYKLTDYLTHGGQAWIYAAQHSEGVAVVKAFKQHQSEDEIDEFQDEGRRLKELAASDHVIRVRWLDSIPVPIGKGRGRSVVRYPYIAMELADGGSVKDYIQDRSLTTERALPWLVQAMEGIRYAHKEHELQSEETSRVVHRDIKPANLLVVGDKVKVADFGIAVSGHATDMTITHTQLAKGTLRYMAPEQFHGRAVLASDVYSMAVTGYEMITGTLPINDTGDAQDWYDAIQRTTPEMYPVLSPDGTIDEVAMAVQEPILKGLSRLPVDRFASMGAFQAAIIEAANYGRAIKPRSIIDLGGHKPSGATADEQTIRQTAPYQSADDTAEMTFSLGELLNPPAAETEQLTQELTEEAAPVETKGAVTRRKALNWMVGGLIAVAVEETARRNLTGEDDEKKPDTIETKTQAIVSMAEWAIDRCKRKKQDNDAFALVRYLIPVDHKAAYAYIKDMPLENVSWLAADLAFYDPAAAETIMKKYEAKKDYTSATRIALALAFYAKDTMSAKSSDYISGVPVEPVKYAAYTAANRVADNCENDDLETALDLAGALTYLKPNFGRDRIDGALEALDGWMAKGQYTLVEMLCRVIARDHPTAVKHCMDYYIGQAAKTTGTAQATMLSTARDLAIDLAPFAAAASGEALTQFEALSTTPAYAAAADAIAMALAPFDAGKIKAYVSRDFYGHAARMPIGIAPAQRFPLFYPELEQRAAEPTKSWLRYAYNPVSATLADKARKALANDTVFSNYGYWVVAATLRSRTDEQK